MRLSELGSLQNVGLMRSDSTAGNAASGGSTEGATRKPPSGGTAVGDRAGSTMSTSASTYRTVSRSGTATVIKAQPAAAPPRTTVAPVICAKGTVSDGKGGCKMPSTTSTGSKTPGTTTAAPPVVTVMSCPAGTHLNKPGTGCLPDIIVPSAPNSTTSMTETTGPAPTPEPTSIQVTTPSQQNPGTGESSGGGNQGGPSEPEQQYAPPSDFVAPETEKRVGGEVIAPPGTSTGGRTALYVGGALAALGLGYLAFKKLSGERT